MRGAIALAVVVAGLTLASGCGQGTGGGAPGAARHDPATIVIAGTLTYGAGGAAPPKAEAIVELRDVTRGEGRVVAERRIALTAEQAPIPFELGVPRAALVPGMRYGFRAGVVVGGRPAWATETVVVDPASARVDLGTLAMAPVQLDAFSSQLVCGDERVRIGFTQDAMRLTVAGETFEMRPVPSGADPGYAATSDPTTTFSSSRDRAWIVLRGHPLPECQLVK